MENNILSNETFELKSEIIRLKFENIELHSRLKNVHNEEEGGKEYSNTLHNELLTLRGEVTAYKHCIAALTGTESPLEVTVDRHGMKL